MKNVAILDLECTGLSPETDSIIEVGVVLWSIEHRTILECYSSLLPATSNAANRFNGISEDVLKTCGSDPAIAWDIVFLMAKQADAVVTHQADFDRGFVTTAADYAASFNPDDLFAAQLYSMLLLPWICTVEDFEWPAVLPHKNLTSVALAHGVAVTSAHRAIHDCLLLARLFERVEDSAERLEQALFFSRRPKAEFVSLAPFEENAVVKAAGFHFDGASKKWRRKMAIEDAEKLPFKVVQL